MLKDTEKKCLVYQGTKIVFLKYTILSEECKNWKMGFAKEPEEISGLLVFPIALAVLQSLWYRRWLFSMFQGHQKAKIWLKKLLFLQNRIDFIHMCHNLYRFYYCAFAWKLARAFSWYLSSVLLMCLNFHASHFTRFHNCKQT